MYQHCSAVVMFSRKINRVSSPTEIRESILGRPLPSELVKYFLLSCTSSSCAAHQVINISTSLSIWHLLTPFSTSEGSWKRLGPLEQQRPLNDCLAKLGIYLIFFWYITVKDDECQARYQVLIQMMAASASRSLIPVILDLQMENLTQTLITSLLYKDCLPFGAQ